MTLDDLAIETTDAVSIGVVIGTLANWLPHVAALFSLIWTAIRVYEWVSSKISKRGD